jgi:putative redox protein
MAIKVVRDLSGLMKQQVHVREHTLVADVDAATGGEDAGPSPHDLYDAALGACKALTVLVYAKRKNIAVENVEVTIERDATQETKGIYKLKALLSFTGDITDAQREDLLKVAGKCPVHKLMTQVTTEIETVLL